MDTESKNKFERELALKTELFVDGAGIRTLNVQSKPTMITPGRIDNP